MLPEKSTNSASVTPLDDSVWELRIKLQSQGFRNTPQRDVVELKGRVSGKGKTTENEKNRERERIGWQEMNS